MSKLIQPFPLHYVYCTYSSFPKHATEVENHISVKVKVQQRTFKLKGFSQKIGHNMYR